MQEEGADGESGSPLKHSGITDTRAIERKTQTGQRQMLPPSLVCPHTPPPPLKRRRRKKKTQNNNTHPGRSVESGFEQHKRRASTEQLQFAVEGKLRECM